jgi:alkylation response protein AidB-like acyl-CoA dehydrogenase
VDEPGDAYLTEVPCGEHGDYSMIARTEKGADIVAFLRDYARERINSRLFDARRCIPPYVVLDFGRYGLLGLGVPTEWGGQGLTWTDRVQVVEQLGAIDLTLMSFVGIHNELGIGPILNFGQQSLKDQVLPLLATGSVLAGLAITEEGAGANPRGIKATAELQPSGSWRLNGDKIWVGNGSWAGVLNVFARWSDGKANRVLGFAVSTSTAGVRAGAEATTMGMRGIVQSRMHFSNVEVDANRLLGESNADMLVAEMSFRTARFGIAIAATGAIKRCVQLMLRYGTRRSIATGMLSDHPLFRSALSDAYASAKVLERLTLLIATELDAGLEVPAELFFVCKALGPEYLFSAADSLMQWLGGRGYVEANEAPQILRDARLLRIFEGPTETIRGHLGSLWRHRGGLREFLCRPGGNELIVAEIVSASDELFGTPRDPSMNVGQYTCARYGAIGELVAEGVAWWLSDANGVDESINRWAKRRFETARQRGVLAIGGAMSNLTDLAAELSASIGDVVQSLPGEEWSVDPLLQP